MSLIRMPLPSLGFRGTPIWIILLAVAAGMMLPTTLRGADMSAAISPQPIVVKPVGRIVTRDGRTWVEVFPEFAPALEGITGFSHLWVLYWFHGNDTTENRHTLQVHPRRDPANPLTGVFATRAPVRPNLIGLDPCRLVRRQGLQLEVEGLDAQDGSPVLDLKPYIPQGDALPEASIPTWLQRSLAPKQ